MNKLLLLLLTCVAPLAIGQTMVNPQTQVRWPVLTGMVDPVAPAFPCTSAQYGMPYVNLATNTAFSCSTSGWVKTGGAVTLTGDVTGTSSATVLSKLQGSTLSCGSVGAGFVPVYQTSNGEFLCRQLTGNDIAPSFAITAFTCSTCGTYEVGQTVASPTNFAASYNSLPASASISDGTNTVALTSPFTAGSLAHSYLLNSTGQVNYVLTAVGASTQTATQSSHWLPRSFGGLGLTGTATGATASGTNAALVGDTGTLASGGLAASSVGQVYAVTTTATQYVYLLLVTNVSNPSGGSFTTPGPTVFAMNSPTSITFTNQNGQPITMFLYRSANSFFSGTTFDITVGN